MKAYRVYQLKQPLLTRRKRNSFLFYLANRAFKLCNYNTVLCPLHKGKRDCRTDPSYPVGIRLGATPSTLIMYEISDKYSKIANKLIQTKPALEYIKDSAITIVCLASDEEKKKNFKLIYGDCTKVNPRYAWCCPCDFFITIYEPNIVEFTDKQIEILICHELQHVGIAEGEGLEPKLYVVPHDVEEFNTIIDEYGLYWDMKEDTKINAKRRQP